jgi:hypothetical protein
MYLASATRPDISFAVSKLSRFMFNLGDDHWHTLERVLHYLKVTMSYEIHYSRHPAMLGDIVIQIGYLILIRSTPQMGMCLLLEVARSVMEVLKTDHFDKVNHGGITCCFRYNFYRGKMIV